MAHVNHAEVVVGRLKYLLQAIHAAEANSVDWPKALLSGFRRMTEDQIMAVRIVGGELQKAAEDFQNS